jgi:potassium channel subfamily K
VGVNKIFTQAYYYALISCSMHLFNATMLLTSVLPTLHWPIFRDKFPIYRPHVLLTAPQRTLMFQTIIFTLYLALGGGIFSSIENWTFLDGIYWTNYSLLTIGFGSDFVPSSPVSKIILVPYTAIGIFVLGLVVTSIRALFVARIRERVVWGKEVMKTQRRKWFRVQARGYEKKSIFLRLLSLNRNPRKIRSRIPTLQTPIKWSRDEWEVMRYVKKSADDKRKYLSLLSTFTLFVVIWFGGALLFWIAERVSCPNKKKKPFV